MKKSNFLLIAMICSLVVILFAGCSKNQPGEQELLDGKEILSEDKVTLIHAQSETVLEEIYSKGTTAKLTSLEPAILYLATENGELTQAYDGYKASFTSPSGVMTERYSVVYYRNLRFVESNQTEMISDEPLHIGWPIEVSATPEDGGYITGYRSIYELKKDVLESMETTISHQITQN